MPNAVQTSYSIYPGRGPRGGVARPSEPHSLDYGLLHVASTETRAPRPGDAVIWNATQNRFQVPTTAAEARRSVGIISFRVDTVANDDGEVRYKDGDAIQVGVFGTFWAQVGAAVEYGDQVIFDAAGDDDWVQDTGVPFPTTAIEVTDNTKANIDAAIASLVTRISASLRAVAFTVVSPQPVTSGGIAQVRIGFGRIT